MEVIKRYIEQDDIETTIDLKKMLGFLMGSLNDFLAGVEKRKPEIIEAYKEALKGQLQGQLGEPGYDVSTLEVPFIQEEIANYDELQLLNLRTLLQLWGVPENHSADKLDTTWSKVIKARLIPAFYRAKALVEVMGREPAIKFFKEYIDARTKEVIKPDLEMKDLNPILEKWLAPQDSPPYSVIYCRIGEGKLAWRNDKCMFQETLLPFNDPELTYVVVCYADKPAFEARNPNFVFTRTTTLGEGGPYCDNCLHDKRHVAEIEHPSQEFFVSLDEEV
jgi:hypothetical protein